MKPMNNLESLAAEIGKDIKDIRSRFATKEEMHEATEIDYSQIVTHEELEAKHYLTAHQSLAGYALKSELYNDSDLRNRIGKLESKPNIDVSTLVTKNELAGKNYLTSHQSLSAYALRSELYNDADIKRRISALESRRDNDNQTLSLSGNRLSLTNGGSVELPLSNVPVHRIAKGDIPGGGVGINATIRTSDIMNPDGIKVGDIIEDYWNSTTSVNQGFWKVTAVNGTNVSIQGIGTRDFPTPYNDNEVKRRISALESRISSINPNLVNQNGSQTLKYWAGTETQYNAIRTKDANTIYDIFK